MRIEWITCVVILIIAAYVTADLARLLNTLCVCTDAEDSNLVLGIYDDGLQAAEGLILARYMMFTQVYFHKTRVVYDHHFSECMKHLLKKSGGIFPVPSKAKLKQYLNWNDWRVLGAIEDGKGGLHGKIIKDRKHHRMVWESRMFARDDADHSAEERALADAKARLEGFQPLSLSSETSFYNPARADVPVRARSSASSIATPLSAISGVVRQASSVHQTRLYVPFEQLDSARAALKNMEGATP
jgi:HD superfamily phosphohydrolase